MLQAHHLALHRTLLAVDAALVTAALALSVPFVEALGWEWVDAPERLGRVQFAVQAVAVVVAWLVVTARMQLYRSRRTQALTAEVVALTQAWCLALSCGGFIGYAWHGALAFAALPAAGLGLAFLVTQRLAIRGVLRQLRRRGLNFRRVLFVGAEGSATALFVQLQQSPQFGIRLVGGVTMDAGDRLPSNVASVGEFADLQGVLERHQVDYVLLCPPPSARVDQIRRVFDLCNEAGIACQFAADFLQQRNLRPALQWYGDVPALAFVASPLLSWRMWIKRGIDIAVAGVALVVLAPFLLAIAVLIKLQDGGPVFFAQERVGVRGRRFRCYKFRTMCVGAERMLPALQANNEQDGPAFKMLDDPRVTRIGRVLRKYSSDELPQLWNVFVGDMSLVGPRPPIPTEVERYSWWQRRRISMPPGLTCIWQIDGRPRRVSFREWVEMDLYYVDNWSLAMDFKLLARTVGTVLRGTGT